jgi:nucleotide-binding universal stress UspA family protein
VVVGLDASPTMEMVVAWATREATVRGAALQIVPCEPISLDAHRDALLREAVGAAVVVVGESGPGTARRWLFNMIASSGSRRSSCPVVVVRGHSRPLRRIIVGVDGSSAAAGALEWAAAAAGRHHAAISVMHAWQPSNVGRTIGRTDGRGVVRGDALALADAECIVDLAVRQCRELTDQPVTGRVMPGAAGESLSVASDDTDIVVIGSRGRSGFATKLFGSVALFVAENAACPVAVVHPAPRLR